MDKVKSLPWQNQQILTLNFFTRALNLQIPSGTFCISTHVAFFVEANGHWNLRRLD